MKIYLHSMGCRVNQYEGERIRTGFEASSNSFVEDYRQADLAVINTCSVTNEADREARSLIRRYMRAVPHGKVIITGCYANRAPDELRQLYPEAMIVGNENKDSIPALAGCSMGIGDSAGELGISRFHGRTRAWIKVQDGCNMQCTYCIIPTTRPEMSCRAPEDILAEVGRLLESGYREVVLCGIRLGRYWHKDQKGSWVGLGELIQQIDAMQGDFRIRVSSIEISDMTDRFLKDYQKAQKTVPYFHIPLQSGSDRVLAAMKRWYDTSFYKNRLCELRRIVGQQAAIFTDFMIGFPTETEQDFKESLQFAKEMGYAGMHIFRYSPRDSTPAAQMNPVYTQKELMQRMSHAREADEQMRAQYAAQFKGKKLSVLVESTQKARCENFLEVEFKGVSKGGWVPCDIMGTKGPRLVGSLDPGDIGPALASLQ